MSELNKQIAKVLGIVWDEELTDKMVGAALWVETENHDDEEDEVFHIYDWQNSIEQAIELLEGLGDSYAWTLKRFGKNCYICTITHVCSNALRWEYSGSLTPAEAICKAFLTYKLQENK